MDAIFTWKNLSSYKELDKTFFWHYARIAVDSAKRFHNTILYTDKQGAEDFKNNGISFSKVNILPEIENFKGTIFSIPKLYTMISRREPYVHLDFDVFTNTKYSTTESFAFGYPEVDLTGEVNIDKLRYLNESYVANYDNEFYKYFDASIMEKWDWRIVPNFGVFVVNNPELVKITFKSILNKINGLNINENTNSHYASFIEQFLFMKYIEMNDYEYEFIYKTNPFMFKDSNTVFIKDKRINVSYSSGIHNRINSLKFVHFHGYKKFPTFGNTIVKKLITKQNPI